VNCATYPAVLIEAGRGYVDDKTFDQMARELKA